jgi:hypothetical protein
MASTLSPAELVEAEVYGKVLIQVRKFLPRSTCIHSLSPRP